MSITNHVDGQTVNVIASCASGVKILDRLEFSTIWS